MLFQALHLERVLLAFEEQCSPLTLLTGWHTRPEKLFSI
jgi:hypothetical protein